MKFPILTLSLIACAIAKPALADDTGFFFKPYIGADYDHLSIDYQTIPGSSLDYGMLASESLDGGDIHIGARVHKYLGFEASYLWTADSNKNNILGSGSNSSINVRGATLDAMGYLPLSDSGKFELIATAGVSDLRANINFSGAVSGVGSKSEISGRVGGGAQLWLNDHINARGLVRYQGADFGGIVKDAVIYSLGLNYQF